LAKLVSQTFTRPTRRRFLHRAYLLSVDSIRVECADSFLYLGSSQSSDGETCDAALGSHRVWRHHYAIFRKTSDYHSPTRGHV